MLVCVATASCPVSIRRSVTDIDPGPAHASVARYHDPALRAIPRSVRVVVPPLFFTAFHVESVLVSNSAYTPFDGLPGLSSSPIR